MVVPETSRGTPRPVGGGHLLLPERAHVPSRTACVPVPTRTSCLPTASSPGASRTSAGSTGPSDPLAGVRRPGAGRRGTGGPGGRWRPRVPTSRPGRRRPRSSGRSWCRRRLRSRLERAVPRARRASRRGARHRLGQLLQQIARGVARPDPLGHHPKVGPASSSLTRRNVVAPVTSSLAHTAHCTGAAPPGGRAGEVQVHPAERRMSSADCGTRARTPPPGSSAAAGPQLVLGAGHAGARAEDGTPSCGALRDRWRPAGGCARGRVRAGSRRPPARGATPRSRREGRATSGVPAKTTRTSEPCAAGGVRGHFTVGRSRPNHLTRGSPASPPCGRRCRAGPRTARRRGGRSRAGSPGRAGRTGHHDRLAVHVEAVGDHGERPAAVEGQVGESRGSPPGRPGPPRTGRAGG